MIRKMLVAIDAAGETEHVLGLAAATGRAFGASACVLCVVDPGYAMAPFDDPRDDGPAAVAEQTAAERLVGDAVAHLQATDVAAEGRVTPGDDPVQAILQAATREDADVIVLGHGACSWLRRLTSGSVAAGVLDGAHCPVFVAPVGNRTSDAS